MTQDNDPWRKDPKKSGGGDLSGLLGGLKDSLFGQGGQKNGSNDDNHNHDNGGGFGGRSGSAGPSFNKNIVLTSAGILLLLWLSTGFYVVNEGFKGVELLFGKHSATESSGLRWHAPMPIGEAIQVDTESVNSFNVGSKQHNEGQMLTSDENIVEISLSVQYKVSEPENFLFNVNDPEKVLSEATISSIREVVGGNTVDYILTDGVSTWPSEVKSRLISILKNFEIGVTILRVELSYAKAPKEVQDAFDDAVKAREDGDRYKLQAEAYENKQIPLARGQAERKIQEAEAHKAEVVSKATGEAKRFLAILKSYKQAPSVTRERMYIETLQKMYSNVSNVIVDTDGESPLIYLPINQQQQPEGDGKISEAETVRQALLGAFELEQNGNTQSEPVAKPNNVKVIENKQPKGTKTR